ncbi:MAG: hypothetical protein AAB305_04940, partial [Candidatus Zixiibacteriota bacterium]
CFNGKWVNAYQAVLTLDHSFSNAPVRLVILDVADNSGQIGNNNKFDEKDLQMYIDSILFYETDRSLNVPPWEKDHSVFDLNGDGYTGNLPGTESTAPFDLNINTPPSYSTVQPPLCSDSSFDEMALTDKQILYYYAHSSMFSGDTAVRNALIPCRDTTKDTTLYALLSGKWKVTVGFNCDSSLNPSGSAFGEADLHVAADGTFSGSIALTNYVSGGCGLIRTNPLTGTVHGDLGNITGTWTKMSDSIRMSLTLHCPTDCGDPCNSYDISSNGLGSFRFFLTDSTGSMFAPLTGSYGRGCMGIVPYVTGCRFYRDGTF